MDSKNKPITTLSFTPFHKKTSEICVTNEWVRWSGYTVVNRFTTTELEYTAIRNTCGVFDITPMYKYKVTGKDARQYLDRLVTRNIDKLQPNNVLYIFWCNEQGKVIDDGTLFCISENEYRICSGERNCSFGQCRNDRSVIVQHLKFAVVTRYFYRVYFCSKYYSFWSYYL